MLDVLFEDLRKQAPDHVAVTGDLTNIALESEFVEAARSLAQLGSPDWVSLIPGNHDAYVKMPMRRSWDHWASYMNTDGAPAGSRAPGFADFPTLRVRGQVALVGLCSAAPTPLFQASGELGSVQLARAEEVLKQLRDRGLYRVVLVHHPVVDQDISRRRRPTGLRAVAGGPLSLRSRTRASWTSASKHHGRNPGPGAPDSGDRGALVFVYWRPGAQARAVPSVSIRSQQPAKAHHTASPGLAA